MDSQHRHELEENSLANWLAAQYEDLKPRLPAYGLALVLLVAGLVGLSGWRKASAAAKADRWSDFTVALEGAQPSPELLRQAADDHPGTPVGEWAEITWADGKLFEASSNYFRNREAAEAALEEAVAAYERLVSADSRDVAERASYQLARAYELQGDLEKAREQYGRVTGAFAAVATARAEELATEDVKRAYDWITSTRTESATSTIDPSATEGDFEPDDLTIPEVEAEVEDADETLEGLLEGIGDGPALPQPDAEQPAEDEPADEPAADESAEAPTDEADAPAEGESSGDEQE